VAIATAWLLQRRAVMRSHITIASAAYAEDKTEKSVRYGPGWLLPARVASLRHVLAGAILERPRGVRGPRAQKSRAGSTCCRPAKAAETLGDKAQAKRY